LFDLISWINRTRRWSWDSSCDPWSYPIPKVIKLETWPAPLSPNQPASNLGQLSESYSNSTVRQFSGSTHQTRLSQD